MSDTIYRQEAIEEFKTPGAIFTYGEETCKAIISRLMLVPPAKPEIKCIAKITLTDEQVQEAFEKAKNEILAAQSERRKGKWVFSPDHAEGICTNCNFKIYGRPYNNTYLIVPYNYCPNCGLPMEAEER